ncbi:Coiled-coil domain-containing protein [Fasciola hepatica]|uniref:Coiled-coil domain-containing protein n=1 Tax=Fasciola hepatica TaxID=6192 RepID=A0A4E0QZE3_FASHE|nr:Coiled-coil domain-containing protein [Fasciola hepatica]
MEVITQERIDELKAKLALLEGDRKAYVETAMHALSENKKRVAELRFENNKLRNVLREGLSAEDHIINHVFHSRQADRACLVNKSGSDAISFMDYRTCDAMKKYNALRHMTVQKEERIEVLKKNYQELFQLIADSQATTAGTNKEGKRLRELENRLDKAHLKHQEAEHIRRTYLQIKDKLQEEQLTYGHSLDALEKQIRLSQEELTELQVMYNDAVLARDASQKELKFQEEVIANDRRRREAELSSMKRVAEGKKSSGEKNGGIGNRESITTEDAQGASGSGSGSSNGDRGTSARGAGISEEQQQKIAKFDETFKHIKEVTGLSDLNQIVKRFESQGETLIHLQELKDKAEKQCQTLREERDRLNQQFEELKYSGETELTSVNQLLDQYKKEAETETQRREKLHQSVSDAGRLLVQCKAGVDHIYDKLTFLNGSAPSSDKFSDVSEGQLPEMLRQCNERLDELMTSLEDVDIQEQLNLMEQEETSDLVVNNEFFSKLEGKMPDYNTRIKLLTTFRETSHDDDDTAGEDNDILTRTALKKQSQQIVEMRNKKRQPRKKKRRSK